jgi:hypothetical protein
MDMETQERSTSADSEQPTVARWQIAEIVIVGLLVVLMLGGFAM